MIVTQFLIYTISIQCIINASYYVDAVQDTDSKVHERFGEIYDLFPL